MRRGRATPRSADRPAPTRRIRPLLVVTPGDPDGIGPEIVWQSIRSGACREADLLCVGARAPFERLGAKIIEALPESKTAPLTPPAQDAVWLVPAPTRTPRKRLLLPGYQSGWAIETAVRLVTEGRADALVTGPISKERLHKGGYLYPGHTEFLAKLTRTPHVTMMLTNSDLSVSLVTTHLALKNVSRALTRAALRRTLEHTLQYLSRDLKITHPRIGVAALNPHAGEAGLFGNEEIRVISPEIRAFSKNNPNASIAGPLPADTLFAKNHLADPTHRYDAVVCMYHDQGLIPVKLLDFARTVNVTLGLPIIRTSVDHGVGFDLVGTGRADPTSYQSAVELAIRLLNHRPR